MAAAAGSAVVARGRRGKAKRRGGGGSGKSAGPGGGGGGTARHVTVRWTRWIAYGLIALFALYWATKAFPSHRLGNYAVETDFYWKYGPAARDLLRGKIDIANYDSKGWGYPAAVALVSAFGFEPFRAGQVVAWLSAVLVGWLLYRLHRSLLGPGVALLGLLLLFSNKTFLVNTYEVGTDMFFFAVVLASIALLLRSGAPGWKAVVASGVLGGWAFSTRYNGLFLWPGALALLLALRVPDGALRERLKSAGLWSAAFLAAALPWLVINAVHTGNPLTNSNYVNVGYAVYGEGNWEKFFYGGNRKVSSFADVVFLDPGRFAGTMVKNVFDHLWRDLSDLLPLFWGAMAAIGLVVLALERAARRVWGYVGLWLLYFVTLVPVFYGARFSLPLLAAYVLLAAWPFVSGRLGRPIQSLERSFPLRTMLFLVVWLPSAVQAYQWTEDPANPEQLRAGPYEILPAIGFLKEHGAGAALIARKPHAAFESKMRFVPMPQFETTAALHQIAQKEGARFLLVSGAEVGMRAAMRAFTTGEPVPGFRLVYQSQGALVYEVMAEGGR
jgi:hypothetical protein